MTHSMHIACQHTHTLSTHPLTPTLSPSPINHPFTPLYQALSAGVAGAVPIPRASNTNPPPTDRQRMHSEEGPFVATSSSIPPPVPAPAQWQQRPSQQPERPRTSSTSSMSNSQGGGVGGGGSGTIASTTLTHTTGSTGFGLTEGASNARSDPLDFLTGDPPLCYAYYI